MKTLLSLIFALSVLFLPVTSHAQLQYGMLPYGGYVVAAVPCTCSFGVALYYAPFFGGTSVPMAGALHYLPGLGMVYSYFAAIVPGTWQLGSYTPGAGACMIGVPPVCTLLPTLGSIRQVGTSLPGLSF